MTEGGLPGRIMACRHVGVNLMSVLPLNPVIKQHGNWKRIHIDLSGMGESAQCENIDSAQAICDRISVA